MKIDKRYLACKERFETLSNEEIQRMLDNLDKTLWDTVNYESGKFCPIAIAMNLHENLENPTDGLVKEKIAERFIPTNIFKGVEGEFYTTDRRQDLIDLCHEILNERVL